MSAHKTYIRIFLLLKMTNNVCLKGPTSTPSAGYFRIISQPPSKVPLAGQHTDWRWLFVTLSGTTDVKLRQISLSLESLI
jgi:hypothetical protein